MVAKKYLVVFMVDSGLNFDILVQINNILHIPLEICIATALYWLKPSYYKRISLLVANQALHSAPSKKPTAHDAEVCDKRGHAQSL